MDELYNRLKIDRFSSNSGMKLRRAMITELKKIGTEKLTDCVAHKTKYFNFTDYDKIKEDIKFTLKALEKAEAKAVISLHWINFMINSI